MAILTMTDFDNSNIQMNNGNDEGKKCYLKIHKNYSSTWLHHAEMQYDN